MICPCRKSRKNKMRRLLFSLLMMCLLAGCDKPAQDHPFFPLESGRSWTYKVEIAFDDPDAHLDSYLLTLTNRGRVELNGKEAWRRRSDTGNEYWLRTDEQGVYRVASRGPAGKEAMLDPGPRIVLPAKLSKEAKWSTTTVPYFLKRRNEWPPEFKYVDKYRNLTMNYTIEALDQKVTTPSGAYSGCLMVKGIAEINVWVESDMTYKEVPMENVEWYCPGVGLVQLERREPTTARFFQGGVMRMVLVKTE